MSSCNLRLYNNDQQSVSSIRKNVLQTYCTGNAKFVLSQILYRSFGTFAFIDILYTCISNNRLTITLCNNVIEDFSITKIIVIRLA